MKDPLDIREDPYQCFNEEVVQSQEKRPQVSFRTKPMEVRRLFGPLRVRAKDPARLQEAYDKLTRVERRLEEDILFYWIPEDLATTDAPVEPQPLWTLPISLPEVSVETTLVQLPTDETNGVVQPVGFREIVLSPLNRYDATELPWVMEFEQ